MYKERNKNSDFSRTKANSSKENYVVALSSLAHGNMALVHIFKL